MKAEVYIALGSNLGDRYRNITRAADELKCLSSHFLLSALYEPDPVGFSAQPGFVNAVWCFSFIFKCTQVLGY